MAHHLQLPDTHLIEDENGLTEITVHNVRRQPGIAGQVAFHVDVTTSRYMHDSEGVWTQRATVTVVGSTYGSPGPVMLIIGPTSVFVDEPSRFGETFDEAWAYRFASSREV